MKKAKQGGQVFSISDQSVMCEIKRYPMPRGEEDGVSASRWQATEEVELEGGRPECLMQVSAVAGSCGRAVRDDLVPCGCVVWL